jgi:hypothetical protein
MSQGALGNGTYTIGGRYNMVVGGIPINLLDVPYPAPGIPTITHGTTVGLGDMSTYVVSGGIKFFRGDPLGSLHYLDLNALTSMSTLMSPAGTIIDCLLPVRSVLLGGQAASTPIILGTPFLSALSSYMTAISAAMTPLSAAIDPLVVTAAAAVVTANTALMTSISSSLSSQGLPFMSPKVWTS